MGNASRIAAHARPPAEGREGGRARAWEEGRRNSAARFAFGLIPATRSFGGGVSPHVQPVSRTTLTGRFKIPVDASTSCTAHRAHVSSWGSGRAAGWREVKGQSGLTRGVNQRSASSSQALLTGTSRFSSGLLFCCFTKFPPDVNCVFLPFI